MIEKIKNNVWALHLKDFGSCVYLIKLRRKRVLIDTGSMLTRTELKKDLGELGILLSSVSIIILTHNHLDHTGGINLFKKAKIYGSKKDFKKKKVLNIDKLKIRDFKIIKTPGHTKGSICVLYKEILFSGDTLFYNGIGRTDLIGGSYQEIKKGLEKLSKLKYKILCPGHEY